MHKIDLHTHSIASYDGGINGEQYRSAIESGKLDFVAITDHNSIEFAQHMQQHLKEKIIVGEEIMTSAGEIIGLFLNKVVPPGLSPHETVKQIKDQGGLVYIPHPFETIRKGISQNTLDEIAQDVDIIEVVNGRAFLQNRSEKVVLWSRINGVPSAASSDAHGQKALGQTHCVIKEPPTKESLAELISKSTPVIKKPGLRALMYPKYNKLKKRINNG